MDNLFGEDFCKMTTDEGVTLHIAQRKLCGPFDAAMKLHSLVHAFWKQLWYLAAPCLVFLASFQMKWVLILMPEVLLRLDDGGLAADGGGGANDRGLVVDGGGLVVDGRGLGVDGRGMADGGGLAVDSKGVVDDRGLVVQGEGLAVDTGGLAGDGGGVVDGGGLLVGGCFYLGGEADFPEVSTFRFAPLDLAVNHSPLIDLVTSTSRSDTK